MVPKELKDIASAQGSGIYTHLKVKSIVQLVFGYYKDFEQGMAPILINIEEFTGLDPIQSGVPQYSVFGPIVFQILDL